MKGLWNVEKAESVMTCSLSPAGWNAVTRPTFWWEIWIEAS